MGVDVMTPNVLDMMKHKFDERTPMDYTWIDLGEFESMVDSEYERVADNLGLSNIFTSDPSEVVLPFERMGLARVSKALDKGGALLGTTIERNEGSIVAYLRSKNGDVGAIRNEGGTYGLLVNPKFGTLESFVKQLRTHVTQVGAPRSYISEEMPPHEYLYTIWGSMINHQYVEYMRRVMDADRPVKAYAPLDTKPASNAKRIRKGKRPIFEWKVIDVTAKVEDAEPTTSHGTHASPRRHKRRGHYRHYMDGRKVWIKEMMVGRIEFGYIHHSYEAKEAKKC
jgi:hypothetical protein